MLPQVMRPSGSGRIASDRRVGGVSSNSLRPYNTRVWSSSPTSSSTGPGDKDDPFATKEVYQDNFFDRFMIDYFSKVTSKQLGYEGGSPYDDTYEGYVELSREIMKGRNTKQVHELVAGILDGLLPPQSPERFKEWFPLNKRNAEINALITTIGFKWLVGPSEVQDAEVTFNGENQVWKSGVKIKKCRYLENSGCVGMCTNMCKIPTQKFFLEQFGLPLTMNPDFETLECEMIFGQEPPPIEEDPVYNQPCFAVCNIGSDEKKIYENQVETPVNYPTMQLLNTTKGARGRPAFGPTLFKKSTHARQRQWNSRIGRHSRCMLQDKRPVAARSGEGSQIEKSVTPFSIAGGPFPALALSVVLQAGAFIGVDPAIASSLTAQGRGTAAELQSILEQRGAKLPALTSSPNERKVDVEAKAGSSRELIQELRRQNQEIKELKAELEGADAKKRSTAFTTKAAEPAVTSAAPSTPIGPSTVSDVGASNDNGSSALPVLNVLGIFAAAGLGGYVALQKKDAEEAQVAYESKIEAEKNIVQALQDDLGSIKNLLDGEKALVEKIKQESATASSEYARQLSLEKASKEAVEKEKRLIEQSLSSEQRLADALRVEAEKTSELLEAEKAAKFAADAEAAQLKAQLAEVHDALEEEKRQVVKWQTDTEEANKRLSDARDVNEALEEDLEERAARIAELNAAAAALQDQIMNATAVNASQSELIEKIGKETMNIQQAMSVMRAQAAERALAAHDEREKAREERELHEKEANKFRSEILDAQNTISRLQGEISDAKDEIQRANTELVATKQELAKAQESMQSMQLEIKSLNDKIYEANKALTEEQGDNASLRSQLAAVQGELSGITSSLEAERAEKQQLLDAIDQMKEDYNMMSERVESEQNTAFSLRKEATELKKMIADLETKNRTLGSNLIQIEEQSRAKLAEVEKRLEAAEKNAGSALSSRDDAYLAIDKLEGVIKMLQEDMAESESFALAASAELENERQARAVAEGSLAEMKQELAEIATAEEAARAAVAQEVESLKAEYDDAMQKLKDAMSKAAQSKRTTRKPKVELTEEEKAEKKRLAAEKRKATIARKKKEKEEAALKAAKEETIETS